MTVGTIARGGHPGLPHKSFDIAFGHIERNNARLPLSDESRRRLGRLYF